MDLELCGKRPLPRCCAAIETIDEHRGLLHGGEGGESLDDAFVIDLKAKVNPDHAWQLIIHSNRNGFASNFFPNHPIELVTKFADCQKKS